MRYKNILSVTQQKTQVIAQNNSDNWLIAISGRCPIEAIVER